MYIHVIYTPGSVSAMLNLAKTSHNELTRMWSMACLSHLAEDFCESSTGECPWVQVTSIYVHICIYVQNTIRVYIYKYV